MEEPNLSGSFRLKRYLYIFYAHAHIAYYTNTRVRMQCALSANSTILHRAFLCLPPPQAMQGSGAPSSGEAR